jgi:CubicO group peptidase (beta-lactamase class C family)
MIERVFPEEDWVSKPASELGFSEEKLDVVSKWLNRNAVRAPHRMITGVSRWFKRRAGASRHRVVLIRDGYIAIEWQQGISTHERLSMASAAKSLYSSVLGIAIKEGKLPSADVKVIDYYPEMMDVEEGEGPKPGRFAKPEDRDITFRQLISNMSGYMKPGESPDSSFHYQTFGMNILTHAIAKLYGYYDSDSPEKLPGFGKLIEEKIRDPIGGRWRYKFSNFKHPRRTKIGIFGYYTSVEASARDLARMGYLWLNWGRWAKKQIIPEPWLQEASRTVVNITANCPEEQWRYGYAFWTNDHGKLWPDLPRDSYAASGAGQKHIWVCPSLNIVVAQSPGIYRSQTDPVNSELLRLIAEASKD